MRTLRRPASAWLLCLEFFVIATALAGCAGRQVKHEETFRANTPFSARLAGNGDVVCWSVKKALLNEGYMLDNGGESVVLSGTKDFQPNSETNVTLRLQATCVDNKDGTSTVFATATREVSKLQYVKQSVTAGVSFATITVPAGSEREMRVAQRETIQDPKFYDRFYTLVRRFVAEEPRSTPVRRRSDRDGRLGRENGSRG